MGETSGTWWGAGRVQADGMAGARQRLPQRVPERRARDPNGDGLGQDEAEEGARRVVTRLVRRHERWCFGRRVEGLGGRPGQPIHEGNHEGQDESPAHAHGGS